MSEFDGDATEAYSDDRDDSAYRWSTPRIPEGVTDSRQRVRDAMLAWGEPEERTETAVLLVSELVTNSVRYSARSATVRCCLRRTCSRIRIQVWDAGGDGIPAQRRPPAYETDQDDAARTGLSERGRGLLIVTALAAAWGTCQEDGGRLVWADV
ncbi:MULTISPECIES: ATP-binding protein [unclassified Streptomyces]|uniref:ATP-binding protein n=1 Tax=unclassified Streptomyces TaxID=2593676 RepID=UPI002E23EA83|nr:ATP-binding protein [Streptomyces sp. NBC_01023]